MNYFQRAKFFNQRRRAIIYVVRRVALLNARPDR